MINVKALIASCLAAGIVGCSQNAEKDLTASNGKNKEPSRFGSATDVSRNGELPTNSANSADNGLGGPVQREAGNYQESAASPSRGDEELAKQIKVALTTGSTGTTGAIAENQLTKIDVQAHNGHLVLSGPVASEKEKAAIEKQVAGFPGVKSVENKLTVGGRNIDDKPLKPLVPRGSGNE